MEEIGLVTPTPDVMHLCALRHIKFQLHPATSCMGQKHPLVLFTATHQIGMYIGNSK